MKEEKISERRRELLKCIEGSSMWYEMIFRKFNNVDNKKLFEMAMNELAETKNRYKNYVNEAVNLGVELIPNNHLDLNYLEAQN